MTWKPIETLKPVLWERYLVCYGLGEPCFMMWKTNSRLDGNPRFVQPYFGDLNEMDDYDLAEPGNGPDLWFDLPDPKPE